jgi:hypothetical protein
MARLLQGTVPPRVGPDSAFALPETAIRGAITLMSAVPGR